MADPRERNMEDHERMPNPHEAPDLVDAAAKVLRDNGVQSGSLRLYAAYRPKAIVTGKESDLVLVFEQVEGGKDVKVELDLRIHNPR